MEISHEFEVNVPKTLVIEYFSSPQNLLSHIPAFRDLKQIDENTWELDVKWLFTIKLTVTRKIFTDEVNYTIKKSEGLIKLSGYLRHIIIPKGSNRTLIRIIFFYQGPFESIAKRQAEEYLKKGMKFLEEDLNKMKEKIENSQGQENKIEIKEDLLKMETIMAKETNKSELENIIAKAMIESIESEVLLLISDGSNIVKLKFKDGSLEETEGDLNILENKIKVLMKRQITRTNSMQ